MGCLGGDWRRWRSGRTFDLTEGFGYEVMIFVRHLTLYGGFIRRTHIEDLYDIYAKVRYHLAYLSFLIYGDILISSANANLI
jgi:hypothetical protein